MTDRESHLHRVSVCVCQRVCVCVSFPHNRVYLLNFQDLSKHLRSAPWRKDLTLKRARTRTHTESCLPPGPDASTICSSFAGRNFFISWFILQDPETLAGSDGENRMRRRRQMWGQEERGYVSSTSGFLPIVWKCVLIRGAHTHTHKQARFYLSCRLYRWKHIWFNFPAANVWFSFSWEISSNTFLPTHNVRSNVKFS